MDTEAMLILELFKYPVHSNKPLW